MSVIIINFTEERYTMAPTFRGLVHHTWLYVRQGMMMVVGAGNKSYLFHGRQEAKKAKTGKGQDKI